MLLRARTGHDFSHYKHATVTRRIERRMAVHQLARHGDYVRYLQQTPAEVEALFCDLLIGVTSFFRDPAAFAALEEQAIPRLFAGRSPDSQVRVWVPGCSTGEEAYSIAILLQERMEALRQAFKIQVFATDIDRRAIERARAGVYPASIAADVAPQRLARFFSQEPLGGAYRVAKGIRDLLVFSVQDVIKDPPFSHLDLISCRNLLIYLDGDLQKKLLPLFHYALGPGGLLFLGTSETVGDLVDSFGVLDRAARLYQRREHRRAAHDVAAARLPAASTGGEALARPAGKAPGGGRASPRELAERALLQHCAPVGALVDERGDILFLHGRTGLFLEPAPGDAALNVVKMAREGLRRDLQRALHHAVAHQEPACHAGLRLRTNGGFTTVTLTVRPVGADPGAASAPALYLCTFEKVSRAPGAKAAGPAAVRGHAGKRGPAVEARLVELQRELRAKEEYLQAANEQLEASNEELKSSNEEMQSVNEELQSTNEELETSKEELQSVNEELATVNTELQQKVADLSRANNDMNNLLAGIGIGTIFVDHQLRIQRFTPAATELINLITTDVGRPVGHLVSNLRNYDRLVADVQAVLATLVPSEVEVQTTAGAWYSLRIRPYRTQENVIDGVVITFVEITELRRARAAAQEGEALRRLAVVVRDARDAITVEDLDGRILAWNPAAVQLYGWSEAEALAMNVRELIPEAARQSALAAVRRLAAAETLQPFRAQRLTREGVPLAVQMIKTALVNDAGEVYAIATTARPAEAPRQ